MSDLRSLYDSIDLGAIRELISKRHQEDLHLEFKVLGNNRSFKRDDRRNLAVAVSGFANSDGGIVVWGVVAEKDDDAVDAASREQPVENVHAGLSELQGLTGSAASPVVDGVLHKSVQAQGDAGFLVTFVPPSDRGPHMAKLGEDRYYKRSGDSFRKMEHFDVADMFGRRVRPDLSLHTRILRAGAESGPSGTYYGACVIVGIKNAGRGVARFPSLSLSIDPPHRLDEFGLDGNRRTGLPQIVSWGPQQMTVFAGGSDQVVHVESVLEVTRVKVRVPELSSTTADLKVRYRITADGIPPIEGEHVTRGTDILRVAREQRRPS